jgi:Na+-driven multidrug efflux pump
MCVPLFCTLRISRRFRFSSDPFFLSFLVLVDRYEGEARRQLRLAWPLILNSVLSYGLSVISIIFTGHISAEALSASVLGTSLYNITGEYSMISIFCLSL